MGVSASGPALVPLNSWRKVRVSPKYSETEGL